MSSALKAKGENHSSSPARAKLSIHAYLGFIIGFGFSQIFQALKIGDGAKLDESIAEKLLVPTSSWEEARANRSSSDGWKDIHVFYGNSSHAKRRGKSQVGQDELVMALFNQKKHGFFVDLAANHATFLSNSYHLEKKLDWGGLCIEPNPVYWKDHTYRKCQLVAAVVGKNRMEEMDFAIPGKSGDGDKIAAGGGIVGKEFDRKPNSQNSYSIKVFTVPFLEVLQRHQAPGVIDYLSLDVEGAEYFIMKDFPFDQFKFRVATIERPIQELVDLLYEKGYQYYGGNNKYGDETLWVHNDETGNVNLTAIASQGWLTGSTLRYPRPERGAKPVVDLSYKGRIGNKLYDENENAAFY